MTKAAGGGARKLNEGQVAHKEERKQAVKRGSLYKMLFPRPLLGPRSLRHACVLTACCFASLVFVLLLTLSSPSPLYAQTETATISGLVTDESSAVMPGAEVKLQSVERGTVQGAATNNAGIYVFANVQPGQYQIRVHKPGFKQVDFLGLIVNVQDHIEQNFRLQIGSVSESITVEANGLNINTTDATVSTVVDRQFAENLPLNGRSFNTLLQLTPGVVIVPVAEPATGQFSINGQRANSNSFLVDGVSANFGIGVPNTGLDPSQGGGGGTQAFNAYGGTNSLVSVDALQEFRVETSSFAPEFGRAPGGQIIIETRPGSNHFHGDAFDYWRNTILDASDWFNNRAGLPRTPEHQNDFGGFLGGPIIRDKTFFFFSYEGLRLLQPQTRIGFVPSLSVRNAAIPAAAPYLNAFPQPNGPVDSNRPNLSQFIGTYDNRIRSDATSMRIDESIGSKWRAFGRYNHAPSRINGRGSVLSEVDTSTVNTQTLTAGLFTIVTSTLINSLRFNYSSQSGTEVAAMDHFGGAIPPNPTVLIPSPLSASSSVGAFAGSFVGQYAIGRAFDTSENQINVVEALAFTRGTHQLKVGFDYRVLHLDSAGVPATLSYLVLQQQLAGFAATAELSPNRFQYFSKRAATVIFPTWGTYGQDTWRVTPRLTLTYGVRWEIDPAPSAGDRTILAAWRNTANPQQTTLAPPGTALWTTSLTNFAPRFAVAYRLTPGGDLVVRGGGGIFYDSGTGLAPSLAINYPNVAVNRLRSSVFLPVANVSQYAPTISFQPPYPGVVFYGFSETLKVPRSYQWNVALEKSFGGDQSLSLTYVGQVGRDLLRQIEEQDPNANFGAISTFLLTTNGDTSDYHALQVQYRRSFSHGLQALVNYSFSHCIDTNSTDAMPVVPGALAPAQGARGPCDFDARHSGSGALTYALPRLTNNRVLGQIVNRWSVDTVVQARTGFPINVTYKSFSIPNSPFGQTLRPDRVPGVPAWLYGSSCLAVYPSCPGGQGLNPAAFDSQTPMNARRQGNAGRNAVTGLGATEVNLSVMKSFPIKESFRLELRADIFNLLNHPNFAPPDSQLDDGALFGTPTRMLNRGLGGLTALYQLGGPRSMQLSLKLHF